jgi:hypothetical protein
VKRTAQTVVRAARWTVTAARRIAAAWSASMAVATRVVQWWLPPPLTHAVVDAPNPLPGAMCSTSTAIAGTGGLEVWKIGGSFGFKV